MVARTFVLPGAVLFFLLLPRGTTAAPLPEPKASPADPPEIRKLLKERRDMLDQEVKARLQEFMVGRGTLDILLPGPRELLDAELELVDKSADSSRAYQAHFDHMKLVDEVCKGEFAAGRLSVADYSQARAARLAAEVGLLRSKNKAAAPRR
jgi:hypothetical protein